MRSDAMYVNGEEGVDGVEEEGRGDDVAEEVGAVTEPWSDRSDRIYDRDPTEIRQLRQLRQELP